MWWIIALAIFLTGCIVGVSIFNTPEYGNFPMNPAIGVFVVVLSGIVALAIVIGHFL